MRVMAIDYGDRRIGIAVSDALGVLCGDAFTMEEWNMERAAQRIAADYIACMTDTYAIHEYKRLFVPAAWS